MWKQGEPVSKIALAVDRSILSVYNKASHLGLHRLDPKEISFPDIRLSGTEKGYIAGIIDGEGYICIFPRRDTQRRKLLLTLGIGNTYLPLLLWLKSKIGGYIIKQEGRRSNHRDIYTLRIDKKSSVIAVLEQVEPFLIIKKGHAELSLQYLKSRLKRLKPQSNLTEEEMAVCEALKILNIGGKGRAPA